MLDTSTRPDAPATIPLPTARITDVAAAAAAPTPASRAPAFAAFPPANATTSARESNPPRRRWRIPTDPPPV